MSQFDWREQSTIHTKTSFAWKVACWTVDSPLSTTKHNLKEPSPSSPLITRRRKKGRTPSLHDMTSHWLHENFIFSKIGCHYFWPGLNSPSYEHPTYPILFYSSKAQKVGPASVDAFVLTFNCLLLATNSKHLPLQNNPPIS
jgi:hypothetical protein